MPPLKTFGKTIYSKGLKLSVTFHSSFAEIVICQLCVHHFLLAMATANFMNVWRSKIGSSYHRVRPCSFSLPKFCPNHPNQNAFVKGRSFFDAVIL